MTGQNPGPATPFAAIRHETPVDGEYWTGRELAGLLGYTDYRNFRRVADKARMACANSGYAPADHFVDITEMVTIGSGARRRIVDVRLSRYACYLIIQNGDPEKEIVALGQTYFAVQTRRMEQADEIAALPDAQKRLYLREQLSGHNRQLADAARGAGVTDGRDFAIFQDHGYRGLYGGLGARDIHARKSLVPNQSILDHMDSEELAANLFRSTQTTAKIQREGLQGKETANQVHHDVGRKVRDTIAELGGTMPENLPTPAQSIQQLQQAERKRLRPVPAPRPPSDADTER